MLTKLSKAQRCRFEVTFRIKFEKDNLFSQNQVKRTSFQLVRRVLNKTL